MRVRNGVNRMEILPVLAGMFCATLIVSGLAQAAEDGDELARLRQMNTLDAVEKRDIRDPFWPVGFYPEWWRQPVSTGENGTTEVTKPDKRTEARKLVKVSGMSRMGSSGFFAVVNGRTVTEGDVVSVVLDGTTYRWTVSEIGDKGLKLAPVE